MFFVVADCALFQCFSDVETASEHIYNAPYRATVVKASGLAAGKGVVVAANQEEACLAVKQILKVGNVLTRIGFK